MSEENITDEYMAQGVVNMATHREDETDGTNTALTTMLSSHIRSVFCRNNRAKSDITDTIRDAFLTCSCKYASDVLARLEEAGGSTDFYPLSLNKAKGGSALMEQVYHSNKPWVIEPTPVPELGEDKIQEIGNLAEAEYNRVSQMGLTMEAQDMYQFGQDMRAEYINYINKTASESAEKMSRKIDDILVEGGFKDATSLFFDYITRYPAGFIRLKPVSETVPVVTGKTISEEKRIVHLLEAVNPLEVFPSPGAKSVQDGDLVIVIKLDKSELSQLRDVDGYSSDEIEVILNREKQSYSNDAINTEYPEAELYQDWIHQAGNVVVGLEYWGNVPGSALIEWGMTAEQAGLELDELSYYAIHAIMIGDNVIYASINNNPKKSRFVYSSSYIREPDSVWGTSIVEITKSPQKGINTTRRSGQNNMQIASGPQVMVDSDAIMNQLPNGSTDFNVYPWKVWTYKNKPYGNTGSGKPIDFFQPEMNSSQLLSEQRKYEEEADELSGIPRYMSGSIQGAKSGAAGTASGLKMLMDQQNTTFKKALTNIDNGFIEPLLHDLYFKLMADPEIHEDHKGDFKIKAMGATGINSKDYKDQNRLQFLALVTQNQVLQQLVKPEGLMNLLRDAAKAYDLGGSGLVPTKSEIAIQSAQQDQAKNLLIQMINSAVEQGIIAPEQAEALLGGGQAQRGQEQIPEDAQGEVQ